MEISLPGATQNFTEVKTDTDLCNIELEFRDFSHPLELTNVFQLRVEKTKVHLKRLIEALLTDKRDIITDIEEEERFETDKELKFSIKEQLAKITYDLSVNKYINKDQIISVRDLLSDSCTLVSRLETDRSNIEEEIIKQKEKVADLLEKITAISFFRMEMLPSAVQKEHEACSNDISELQWHIKHRSQIEKKLRIKSYKAADINAELKKGIQEIKEEIPLVVDKLGLEESMMQKIQDTKEKLIQDSESSAERRSITQQKHDEANKKTKVERQHIKRDLFKANKTLESVQKKLLHGEKEHGKLLDFKARSEKKIMENHAQLTKLNEDNARKSNELRSLEETVDNLDRKYKELQFDNKWLDKSKQEKEVILLEQEENQKKITADLTNKKQELDQRLVSLKRTNKQMEIEIGEIKGSQEKCIQETERKRKNIQSTKEEITESEKRFQEAIDEFTRVSRQHASIQMRLTKEMASIREAEDRLKKTLNDIEQGIKQEISSKTNFKTRIITDTQDLDVSKNAALEKRKEMQKVLNEVMFLAKQARDKVELVDNQHRVSSDELNRFQIEHDDLISHREKNKSEKQAVIENLTPIYDELVKKLDTLTQKAEHLQWQIQTMNSQLKETSSAVALIDKSKKKVLESLLEIDKQNNIVTLELESCRGHIRRTEDALSQISAQSDRLKKTHEKYMLERRLALEELEKILEVGLVENRDLAAQYRLSQTDYYSMEDAFLDVIQEHLWGEESIKDIKELQRLQKYMHNNLEMFFSLKLVYNKDLFDDLRQESGQNEEKIKQLRVKYTVYVEKLNEFLRQNFSNECKVANESK